MVKLIECPRDAMQGWSHFIPTEKKIEYLNALLQVGFDSLDFGSFVSPKAIPQMADTKEVISRINPGNSKTRLLAIVANTRGAEDAALYPAIRDLGFPFSISETFQQRNTNASIQKSVETVAAIQEICFLSGKTIGSLYFHGFWKSLRRPLVCRYRLVMDPSAGGNGSGSNFTGRYRRTCGPCIGS